MLPKGVYMDIAFKDLCKLTKREREVYAQCRGHCHICLLEGGCDLAKKLNKGVSHGATRDL